MSADGILPDSPLIRRRQLRAARRRGVDADDDGADPRFFLQLRKRAVGLKLRPSVSVPEKEQSVPLTLDGIRMSRFVAESASFSRCGPQGNGHPSSTPVRSTA